MMMLGKREESVLLLLLVVLTIAIRVPTIPHEYGVDSFFIHWMAESISQEGDIKWFIHPLSAIGLYPFSYTITVPLNLSIISQVIGIDIEKTILLVSIFLGVLGAIFSYMMAKELSKDKLTAFFVAFIFSLSPLFIKFTYWTTSTRGMFVALLPLLIWFFLRFENTNKKRYILFAFLLFALLSMIHKMFFFTFSILFAYVLTKAYYYVKPRQSMSKYLQKINLSKTMAILFALFFLIPFTLSYFLDSLKNLFLWEYHIGYFFTGFEAHKIFMNLLIDYGSNIGILSIFLPIGFLYSLRRIEKNPNFLFISLLLLFCTPFALLGRYMTLFSLPILSLLAGFGFRSVIDSITSKRVLTLFIVFSLFTTVIFSHFMIDHWIFQSNPEKGYANWMDKKTYNLASFLKDHSSKGDFVFSSNSLVSYRISALSYIPSVSHSFKGLELFAYDLISAEDLELKEISYSDISFNIDSMWQVVNPNIFADWSTLVSKPYDSSESKELILKYRIKYVVTNENVPNLAGGWRGNLFPSRFLRSISDDKDKLYANGLEAVWTVK